MAKKKADKVYLFTVPPLFVIARHGKGAVTTLLQLGYSAKFMSNPVEVPWDNAPQAINFKAP